MDAAYRLVALEVAQDEHAQVPHAARLRAVVARVLRAQVHVGELLFERVQIVAPEALVRGRPCRGGVEALLAAHALLREHQGDVARSSDSHGGERRRARLRPVLSVAHSKARAILRGARAQQRLGRQREREPQARVPVLWFFCFLRQ